MLLSNGVIFEVRSIITKILCISHFSSRMYYQLVNCSTPYRRHFVPRFVLSNNTNIILDSLSVESVPSVLAWLAWVKFKLFPGWRISEHSNPTMYTLNCETQLEILGCRTREGSIFSMRWSVHSRICHRHCLPITKITIFRTNWAERDDDSYSALATCCQW